MSPRTCSSSLTDTEALIVGSPDDEHVVAVAQRAEAFGATPLVVDAAALDTRPYALTASSLTVAGMTVAVGREARGWIRRLAPPWWRTGVESGTQDAAVRSSYVALTAGLAADDRLTWLTPFDRLMLADNKVVQLTRAAGAGVSVPATAVVSDATAVPAELGAEVLIKPLGPGHYTDDSGSARAVYAQAFKRDELDGMPFDGAPFLAQAFVRADRHLRVVTVNGEAWVSALETKGLPVDWRREESAHHAFEAIEHPQAQQGAVRMSQALGLGYSSQDWLERDGECLLIDVNPGGQWLFLPSVVADDVTAAIAAWLAGSEDA